MAEPREDLVEELAEMVEERLNAPHPERGTRVETQQFLEEMRAVADLLRSSADSHEECM